MIVKVPSDGVFSLTREPAFSFFSESKIDGTLNFEHFCKTWENFIQLDIGAIFVYRRSPNEEPTGIIGGVVTPCPMTADPIASEMFWWVAPFLRGTSPAGMHLLMKWERWAIEKGVKRVYMGNLVELNDSKMKRIYERMGYRPLEIHYVKAV